MPLTLGLFGPPFWHAVRVAAGFIEVAFAATLALRGACGFSFVLLKAMLVAYLVVVVAGEFPVSGFSEQCGCFGPGFALDFHYHLLITGALLVLAGMASRGFRSA